MKIKKFEFNPIAVNTYLLYDDTNEAVLIDCGASNKKEYEELDDYIQENRLMLKYLLSTHLHFDHVLGNYFIYKQYGLKPQYHRVEDSMPGLRAQSVAFGLGLDYESVATGHFITKGELILFGNTSLKALLTPGHSPGSLSFYSEAAHCVFTGDALFYHSIGRTDLWGGSEETLVQSIRSQLLTLPEDTIIYPGHGPSSTVKEEKQHNPYIY